ncbi:exosortase A [Massilia forsythiae]|uniref:Exosortase A n=1 Tax=Massilia forsythiae TaxID=2728020 RepID=A0A7Z2ZS41_9BURK|nr:exosortase A [Massilia forsythiae]QJD99888.1 exosortase A [Massilia forsythiae]
MFLKPPPGVDGPDAVVPDVALSRGAIALMALALLAPFVLYFGTMDSIVAIWNRSETFAHGYVILPISLWLIWRERTRFNLHPATPYAPALALLALLGAGWLAAQLGEVQVVSQYAFVAMLPAIALALFGPRLAGSLTFPLLFVLFAVPFGEVFVAPLIQFTADFTVWAVRATGIPVLRSGTRFELPTGNWSVVEACSGVRYLISSVTLGCLYAYLTYRSNLRRLLFVALAVIVPIIANGLRAYMIVMIGHLSGMELATGVDHLIYGWLFFGLVMFLMFWVGSYWREDSAAPAAVPAAAGTAGAAGAASTVPMLHARRFAPMTAAVLAVAALWPAAALLGERANHNPAPVRLDEVAVGWPQVAPFADWKPAYLTPDARFERVYQDSAAPAVPVALDLLYYRNQHRDKSLISSGNRLAGYQDAWHETFAGARTETFLDRPLALRESLLRGPRGTLLVWSFKWVGGHYTDSDMKGKLWQAGAKALLRGDDGAAVLLSAPYDDAPEAARAALRRFLAQQGAALDAALQRAHAAPAAAH